MPETLLSPVCELLGYSLALWKDPWPLCQGTGVSEGLPSPFLSFASWINLFHAFQCVCINCWCCHTGEWRFLHTSQFDMFSFAAIKYLPRILFLSLRSRSLQPTRVCSVPLSHMMGQQQQKNSRAEEREGAGYASKMWEKRCLETCLWFWCMLQ